MLPKRAITRALTILLAVTAATLGIVAPAQAATIPVNTTVELRNAYTGQCMEAENSFYLPGTDVQQWTCGSQSGRLWYTERVSFHNADYFRLRTAGNQAYCATPDTFHNGSEMDLEFCRATDDLVGVRQLWFYEDVGGGVANIHNYSGGPDHCLEINNGVSTKGANVQFWDCAGKRWQSWWAY